jgi:hypothetical protein
MVALVKVGLVALVTVVAAAELAFAAVEATGWACICHPPPFACTRCNRCTP